MSRISDSFFVKAIEDGTTIYGSLQSDQPLTQGWKDGVGAVPNWDGPDTSKQPTIYPVLLSGNDYISPRGINWYYNTKLIEFDGVTHKSIGDFEDMFESTTYDVAGSLTVPALKITANLASPDNKDNDVIKYEGEVVLGDARFNIKIETLIRITEIVKGGYIGMLSFPADVPNHIMGGGVIYNKNEKIKAVPILYSGDDMSEVTSGIQYEWYLDLDTGEGKITNPDWVNAHDHSEGIYLKEGDILSSSVLFCKFIFTVDGEQKTCWASDTVLDHSDPEELRICNVPEDSSQDIRESKGESIHFGQSTLFKIFVSLNDNMIPLEGWDIYIKVFNSGGFEVKDTAPGNNYFNHSGWNPTYIGADNEKEFDGDDSNEDGWRPLKKLNPQSEEHPRYARFVWDLVNTLGKSINCIVLAEHTTNV